MDNKYFTLAIPKDGRPEKTYFYKRPDGSIFACSEKQASEVQKQKVSKLVGVGDGQTFWKKLREAVVEQSKALDEIGPYPEGGSGKKRQAWREAREKIAERAKKAIEEAQEAEIVLAKKHKKAPPDFSVEINGGGGLITPQMIRGASR